MKRVTQRSAQFMKYSLSATDFCKWALSPKNIHIVKGIIEHHAHHLAVKKYQLDNVTNTKSISQDKIKWLEQENMPKLIASSKLIYSEKDISSNYKNIKLIGRVDQLYQLPPPYNEVALVDTKSHVSPTLSDQLQLSFYQVVLSERFAVAGFGYVRSCFESVNYHSVDLVPVEAMKEIFDVIINYQKKYAI